MHIVKLDIRAFGKLNNLVLDFYKGFNIVFGSNEAGKTSLQWFIKAMLFGLKGGRASKDGILPPLKRFKPWNSNDFAGFMEYRLDSGELYRVGRNYNAGTVKIYDSYFNDITGTFETSREKGVRFAEKHLGINETCFEKTVFVGQMESRIGYDDSRELLNRLVNATQTGFEDVSFKRAQEALKEALKSYVGTEKTTTRPLDRLIARLNEIKDARDDLVRRREAILDVYSKLKEAADLKNVLAKRKTRLSKLRELAGFAKKLLENHKSRCGFDDMLKNIIAEEEELKAMKARIEAYTKEREQLAGFSAFSLDDIVSVDNLYNRMISIQNDARRIDDEVARKRDEICKTEHKLEQLKAFNYLGNDTGSKVLELNRDLEHLKKEHERINLEDLNEKIRQMQRREKGYIYISVVFVALSAVFFLAGLMGINSWYFAAAAAIVLALAFGFFGIKEAGKLKQLRNEKKIYFISINRMVEETNRKRKELEEIYNAVGASSIDEFFRLKSEYDTWVNRIKMMNEDLTRLENESRMLYDMAFELKKAVCTKLEESGIIGSRAEKISDEHIESFKLGVKKYISLESDLYYASRKTADLISSLQRLYKNASSECGESLRSRDEFKNVISRMENKEADLKKSFDACIDQAKSLGIEDGILKDLKDCILKDISDINEIEKSINDEWERVDSELNDTLLKIREYETLLKGACDDELLQSIDEEIAELEAKKINLENIHLSLKTALEVMTEASQEIQKDYVPMLNSKMSSIIKRISCGRYMDLRADDNLALKVIAPEIGDVISAQALSGGTIDQMYLALRIAMADMINAGQEKLPFVMDETLAQYDDNRTRETLEFIRELSDERQIILFTCKRREVDMAREACGSRLNIVELK